MSHLPLPAKPTSVLPLGDVIKVLQVVDSKQVKLWSSLDPLVSHVLKYTHEGCPQENIAEPSLKQFYSHRNELSVDNDCLLWGSRVVVPLQGHKRNIEKNT